MLTKMNKEALIKSIRGFEAMLIELKQCCEEEGEYNLLKKVNNNMWSIIKKQYNEQ